MELQLSFLETTRTDGAAPVWSVLDDEARAEIVAMLARLIAKMADDRGEGTATVTSPEEKDDE